MDIFGLIVTFLDIFGTILDCFYHKFVVFRCLSSLGSILSVTKLVSYQIRFRYQCILDYICKNIRDTSNKKDIGVTRDIWDTKCIREI